jgi:hypothetical protein
MKLAAQGNAWAYDDLDLETDDIFLWLSRNVEDPGWRSRVRDGWRDGSL